MIPFYVLGGAFAVFLLLGRVGIEYFAGWQHALRAALGAMFLLTASAHWGRRRPDLVAMVPPAFSRPELWVTLTGVLEIAGAAGLQIPRVAMFAAAGLFLMLIAMFPANALAAKRRLTIGGRPATPLLPRLLLQVIFLAALAFAAVPRM